MKTTGTQDIAQDIARAEQQVRDLTQQLADAKAELRTLRGAQATTRSQPRACECGCGGITAGGMFCPGHDAKMRSRLITTMRGGTDEEAAAAWATLQQYPRLTHGIGPWDLGRDRREAERKQTAAAAREEERAANQARRDADKAARERLQTRSREEQNKIAEHIAVTKDAAIAEARKNKLVVPSGS
jgi:hypothetical protein